MSKLNGLVAFVPELPDVLPERIKAKPKITDLVEPHASALYAESPEFRELIGSVTRETSPSGSIKYDEAYAADMVVNHATKNGKTLAGIKPVKIGFGVTMWARRFGIARSQRIAEAKQKALEVAQR